MLQKFTISFSGPIKMLISWNNFDKIKCKYRIKPNKYAE